MARIGADPDDLDALAQRLDDANSKLSGARTNLGGRLRSTYWEGPNADAFRSWWGYAGAPNLDGTGQFMSELARFIRDEAEEQRWASTGAPTGRGWPGGSNRPLPNDPVPDAHRRGPSDFGYYANLGSGDQSDPVDSATGAFWFRETDLSLVTSGGMSLALERFHHAWLTADLSFGPGWTSILDARLYTHENAVGIQTEEGSFIKFRERAEGYDAEPGVIASLERSAAGWMLHRPDGVLLSFDEGGLLRSVSREAQTGFTIAYEQGRVSRIDNVAGGAVEVVWDGNHVAELRHPWNSARFAYDNGSLVSATTSEGTSRYVWDDDGRITEQHDRRGRLVVANTYGDDGRVVEQRDDLGGIWQLEWDNETSTSTMTDPTGAKWSDRYSDGVLVERRNPVGGGIAFERNGVRIERTTSLSGELLASANSVGTGELSTDMKDFVAEVSGFTIERNPANDELISAIEAGEARVSFEHDEHGRTTRMSGSEGSASFDYEGSELVGVRTDFTGLPTRIWIEDGDLWVADDAGDRVLAEGDEHGRITAWIDAIGRRTTQTYDERDRLVGLTTAAGATTAYEFDGFDRLLTRTDAIGRTLRFGRDEAQQLQSFESEDGADYQFELDLDGRVVRMTDGAGRELAAERNSDGHVTSLRGSAVDVEIKYEDGQLSSIMNQGRRAQIGRDETGPVSVAWDDGPEISYEYDDLGRVTAKRIDGVAVELGYLGNLEADINGPAGRTTVEHVHETNTLSLVLPNGAVSAARFFNDELSDLSVSARGARIFREELLRNDAGQLVGLRGLDYEWAFEYDDADMLTHAVRAGRNGADLSWCYDAVGNRLSESLDDSTVELTLDERSRPTGVVGDEPSIGYDDCGYVVADGQWTYQYDARGGLRLASSDDVSVEHHTDGLGNRVRTIVTESGTVVSDTSIAWDLSVSPAQPVLATDNLTNERYLYQYDGVGAPLAVVPLENVEATRWFITDYLGSVRMVLDADGGVLGQQDFAPFGEILSTSGDCLTGPLTLGFTGAVREQHTGLIHLGAREYRPEWGRFLAPDPEIADIGEMPYTGYAYTFNRPTTMVDPTGLWPGFVDNAIKKVTDTVSDGISTVRNGMSLGTRIATRSIRDKFSRAIDGVRSGLTWVGRKIQSVADVIYEHRSYIKDGLKILGYTAGALAILAAAGIVTAVAGVPVATILAVAAGVAAVGYGLLALASLINSHGPDWIEAGSNAINALLAIVLHHFGGESLRWLRKPIGDAFRAVGIGYVFPLVFEAIKVLSEHQLDVYLDGWLRPGPTIPIIAPK